MTFNYGLEKKKFEKEWEQTAKFYAEQGMSQEAIDAMREFDWDVFKANRIEALHTQSMNPPEGSNGEDGDGAELFILKKYFEQFTSQYDTYGTHSRYWWLEEIEDERLLPGIAKLTEGDKELLTLYYVEQLNLVEVAEKLGIKKSTVGYRLKMLVKLFRNEQ